ncbi:uncharacterized protein LACBIDRAFT_308639 [Laccaria bicolor S238N-H82]|uniref:Predicted protein n=1 Tax=Laccaria bicolor (strain S238N-H82 / ATCC MYA-4686) TaxID=486041 RepID=B0CWV0_LACBS|nr:uncharacterized protein LACBIDRAFT_308639 [Laccaria bicolor S238N-H82]EDR13135.1 predicted protein [Laccaria bicolor S238N-H82]|eukprot:XP_001875633.1 predicted protein [Laccaria bicolor S238N-H82]
MAACFPNALRPANHLKYLMLKCMRTRLGQRLVTGLRRYSHASASSSPTNDEKSETRATEPSQRKEGYTKRPPVSTLDQRKLSPTDWLDLSGRMQLSISFRNKLDRDSEWRAYYRRLTANRRLPFPPHSSGFLYYHQPPGAPLLAGELRFRLTSNHLPESFNQGEDCLTPEGDAWKIPLFVLHHTPFHRDVYQQLRVDGFVSDALDSQLKSIAQTSVCPRSTSVILHSLHQVFPVDFSATTFRFFVVGNSTLQNVFIFPFHLRGQGRASSYTSKGLVRFELSTLPEHAGTRTVVMRVVKLVGDPGPYMGEDRPQEGALVLRHHPAGGKPKLFSLNVDRNTPVYGSKGFSHPDALPLLVANTFGNKQSCP